MGVAQLACVFLERECECACLQASSIQVIPLYPTRLPFTHTHGPPARRPPSPTPSKLTYHGLHAVEERKRRQKEEKVMFYTKK